MEYAEVNIFRIFPGGALAFVDICDQNYVVAPFAVWQAHSGLPAGHHIIVIAEYKMHNLAPWLWNTSKYFLTLLLDSSFPDQIIWNMLIFYFSYWECVKCWRQLFEVK